MLLAFVAAGPAATPARRCNTSRSTAMSAWHRETFFCARSCRIVSSAILAASRSYCSPALLSLSTPLVLEGADRQQSLLLAERRDDATVDDPTVLRCEGAVNEDADDEVVDSREPLDFGVPIEEEQEEPVKLEGIEEWPIAAAMPLPSSVSNPSACDVACLMGRS